VENELDADTFPTGSLSPLFLRITVSGILDGEERPPCKTLRVEL